jgi:type VI secretion system protein ImpF
LSTPRSGAGGPTIPGARRDRPPRVQLPLLDRLMQASTSASESLAPSASEALQRLRVAVLRDLEALLNARRRRVPLPAHCTELGNSLLTYGIPDPASGAYMVPDVRAALAAEVEATIRRFEPRLARVSVTLQGDVDALDGTLKLKVDAVLRAEPVPEAVSFETLLEAVTRDITVREN